MSATDDVLTLEPLPAQSLKPREPSPFRNFRARYVNARRKRRRRICGVFVAIILLMLIASAAVVRVTPIIEWLQPRPIIYDEVLPTTPEAAPPSHSTSGPAGFPTSISFPTVNDTHLPTTLGKELQTVPTWPKVAEAETSKLKNCECGATACGSPAQPLSIATACPAVSRYAATSCGSTDLSCPTNSTTANYSEVTSHEATYLSVSETSGGASSATMSTSSTPDGSSTTPLTTAPTTPPTTASTTAPTTAPTTASTTAPTTASTTAPTTAPTTASTTAPTTPPTTPPTTLHETTTSLLTSTSTERVSTTAFASTGWTTAQASASAAERAPSTTPAPHSSSAPALTSAARRGVQTVTNRGEGRQNAPKLETYVAGPSPDIDTIPGAPTQTKSLEELSEWFQKVPAVKSWGDLYLPMVSSSIGHCAGIGKDAIIDGGSAVDGAIASQICHGFFNPVSAGVGGGSFTVVYDENRNMDVVFNAREAAPKSATAEQYEWDRGLAREGGLAIAVPGEVAGYWRAWRQFGKLPWARLFTRTIYLCEQGHNVTSEHAQTIKSNADVLAKNPVLSEDYVVNGTLIGEGQMLYRRRLGHTLRRIAQDPMGFYNGRLAEDVLRDVTDVGAQWIASDLSDYRALASPALRIRLPNMGATLLTAPPPSLGGMVGYSLSISDAFRYNSKSWDPYNFERDWRDKNIDPAELLNRLSATVHRVTEAIKFGFGLRDNFGDPQINPEVKQFIEKIQDPSMATEDKNRIRRSTLSYHLYFKSLTAHEIRPGTAVDPGEVDAVQTLAVDSEGLVVSMTGSIGLRFGSKRVGRRTGIVFNSAMADFSTIKSPMYKKQLNSIAPGARPTSTMVPAILVDEDFLTKAALGATGGSRGISYLNWAVLYRYAFNTPPFLLRHLIPLIHPVLASGNVERRDFFPRQVLDSLVRMGHKFVGWSLVAGEAQAMLLYKRTSLTWHAFTDVKRTKGLLTQSGVA